MIRSRRLRVLLPALVAIFIPVFLLLVVKRPETPQPVFTPQSITLPDAVAAFPATPAGEALTVNCTACHSPEMIFNQPRLDATKWQAEIDKMRSVYKAQVAKSDDAMLVKALSGLDQQKGHP